MGKKVVLACSECGSRNYSTMGGSSHGQRLEVKKFCKNCNRHTLHKETK